MNNQQIKILPPKKPPDFNSPKVKREMKKIQREIASVMAGAVVDTSKLYITFRLAGDRATEHCYYE